MYRLYRARLFPHSNTHTTHTCPPPSQDVHARSLVAAAETGTSALLLLLLLLLLWLPLLPLKARPLPARPSPARPPSAWPLPAWPPPARRSLPAGANGLLPRLPRVPRLLTLGLRVRLLLLRLPTTTADDGGPNEDSPGDADPGRPQSTRRARREPVAPAVVARPVFRSSASRPPSPPPRPPRCWRSLPRSRPGPRS